MPNKTVYVRVNQRTQSERFFRCAMEFSRAWRAVEVDEATLQRLHEEQMLEVSEDAPEDAVEADATGGSAAETDTATADAAAAAADTATADTATASRKAKK